MITSGRGEGPKPPRRGSRTVPQEARSSGSAGIADDAGRDRRAGTTGIAWSPARRHRWSRARDDNVEIMRAFVRLRRLVAGNAELTARLDELERRYDAQFKSVVDAIRQLMSPPAGQSPRIGSKP
jgi:hypothetical protein